jgi:hypothetical protein
MRPFENFGSGLTAHERCEIEAQLSFWEPAHFEGEWAVIQAESDHRNAEAADLDPLDLADGQTLDEHLARRQAEKRRISSHGTATRTTASSRRVEFTDWGDDPIKAVPARTYLLAIANVEVAASGSCRCPHPDHEDRRPSAMVYGSRWKCFGCGAGGSVIDLAEAYSGIPATGASYWELRDWIVDQLGSEVSP